MEYTLLYSLLSNSCKNGQLSTLLESSYCFYALSNLLQLLPGASLFAESPSAGLNYAAFGEDESSL